MWRGARRRGVRAVLHAALVVTILGATACGGGGFFGKRYEYEEDVTLDLDGSATLIVNASLPALLALRGLDIDAESGRVDRDRIRTAYASGVAEVTRVTRPWRRNGRRFIQIRIKTPDIRRLSEAAPFAWSRYELVAKGNEHLYRQTVGPSAFKPATLTNVGWNGSEVVAFRLHLPSRILEHNARDLATDQPASVQRGNILSWEQQLADRLDGKPVTIAVRMSSQSILHRTLWLFAGAFLAAVLVLGGLIWFAMRRGAPDVPQRQ